MDNIIEYIRTYGQNTFDQKPFNEVDSLVICQLSYMNFQPFVPSLKEKEGGGFRTEYSGAGSYGGVACRVLV